MKPRLLLLILVSILSACRPAGPSAMPSASPSASPSATPSPTLLPTATATRTPPALPGPFQTDLLNPLDTPHTYLADTCQYLQDKWSSAGSPPGTVAMVIMFHSIGGETGGDRISVADFQTLMQALHDDGFQAVTTAQLDGFLEHNASLPERSVLLLVDDRRTRVYFDTFFRPYRDSWGWPVVNAWISLDDSIGRQFLPENVNLEKEGWVDHQAHGYQHNLPMGPGSSEAYIQQELQKPIQVFQQNYGKTPLAVIWPGGGFALRPVQEARELGYRLGFTTNPRGPLLFDWVPLADVSDPQRPSWPADGPMGDPLLVLPRYWDTDAIRHLDTVIQISQQAAAYAQANRSTELEYYDIVCAPSYGPIP
jgi:hypothetical protein